MEQSIESNRARQLQQTYLRALARGLKTLPASKRDDCVRELAGHIEMLVVEGQCTGYSALEATQAALRQFGHPGPVGRRIAWEWHKENFMKTPRLAGVLGSVTVVMSSLWLMFMYWALSRTLFPVGKVLIIGSQGSHMRVESNNSIQVLSGEAGIIGFSSLPLTIALVLPVIILMGVALAGCISMIRRQPATS